MNSIVIMFWRVLAWLFCCVVGHEEPPEASHARACLRRLPDDVQIHLAQISCARCGFMMDVKNVESRK